MNAKIHTKKSVINLCIYFRAAIFAMKVADTVKIYGKFLFKKKETKESTHKNM